MKKEITVIRRKILSIQVCTNYPEIEVEEQTNNIDFCGTRAGWCLSEELKQGVQCDDRKGFKHYVLVA